MHSTAFDVGFSWFFLASDINAFTRLHFTSCLLLESA